MQKLGTKHAVKFRTLTKELFQKTFFHCEFVATKYDSTKVILPQISHVCTVGYQVFSMRCSKGLCFPSSPHFLMQRGGNYIMNLKKK